MHILGLLSCCRHVTIQMKGRQTALQIKDRLLTADISEHKHGGMSSIAGIWMKSLISFLLNIIQALQASVGEGELK